MRDLSTDELIELAETYNLEVGDEEVDDIQEEVNGFLDGLDEIFELPIDRSEPEIGERSWRQGDDPYNAISTRCSVPPTTDHSDLLGDVRVGIKDIITVAGVPMQCASRLMRGYVPTKDATVVRRLRAAGASITAKTNLDEFASCARGTTADVGPIRNPHDDSHTAGGSSGGSAAAVAAGETDVSIGTDTGGSIRMPAALCGVVGFKPTYGLVPHSGVVENTYTQDFVGPIASSVADAALVLEAIAGPDESDPASMSAAGRDDYSVGGYVDAVSEAPDPSDLTVGVLKEGFGEGVDDDIGDRVLAAIDALEDAGASVRPASVDTYDYVNTVKNAISLGEFADHWLAGGAPYRRGGHIDEGYQRALASRMAADSAELGYYYKSKVLAGAHIREELLGAPYVRAQRARDYIRDDFDEALADVDVLALPTMPGIAPRIEDAADPGFTYGRNTRQANVTGYPAITIPSGTVSNLPVGLQLLAGPFEDAALAGTAATVESVLE